jgi:hypothetical protein
VPLADLGRLEPYRSDDDDDQEEGEGEDDEAPLTGPVGGGLATRPGLGTWVAVTSAGVGLLAVATCQAAYRTPGDGSSGNSGGSEMQSGVRLHKLRTKAISAKKKS